MSDNLDQEQDRSRVEKEWKTYHILRAFRHTVERVENLKKDTSRRHANSVEEALSIQWMKYQNNEEACLQIRRHFLEYFQERWMMGGSHSSSNERGESVEVLQLDSPFGLSNAIATYEARAPREPSESGSVTATNAFGPSAPVDPLPAEDPVPSEDLSFYDSYYRYEDLIPPPPELPPSPAGSSGQRSDFSTGSGMMFPMEK